VSENNVVIVVIVVIFAMPSQGCADHGMICAMGITFDLVLLQQPGSASYFCDTCRLMHAKHEWCEAKSALCSISTAVYVH